MKSSEVAKSIFLDLIELASDSDQQALLDERCGNNSDLRQQVLKLLKHDRAGDDFLIGQAFELAATTAQVLSESQSKEIGPYKLMEKIGEGGMGVVYVALQQYPIRRKVALKLIKPGMDSKQVVARFQAERQALAMMNHPNIAKVLDAGTTETGLPYFVMDLVKGLSITEYCQRHQLDLRQRLELFVTVCEAVQHAHQKGVIHRDLKPQNVLVELEDVRSIPKVIDFGVAKALQQPLVDNTVYTGFSQMIGTPLYMSPEQAEFNSLDVDTRSDVYSLGVILYELITGSTPLDREALKNASFDEIRRMVREEEPLRPSSRISAIREREEKIAKDLNAAKSTVNAKQCSTLVNIPGAVVRGTLRSIQHELDWIVMKALEKDRTRRYESASAIAQDVRRYLEGEPIAARPPTFLYRFSKAAKRHRLALTVSSILAGVLLIAAVAGTWLAIDAIHARGQAMQQSELARHAVDDMYTQVAEKWMDNQDELSELQMVFLRKARDYYSALLPQLAIQSDMQWESLRALHRVARIEAKLAMFTDAEASYRRLVRESDSLRNQHPHKFEWIAASVSARAGLAGLLYQLDRQDEARLILREAAQIPNVDGWRNLADLERCQYYGNALHLTGSLQTMLGLKSEAITTISQCEELQNHLLSSNPELWDYRFGVAQAAALRGQQKMWWGEDNEAASRALQKAMDLIVELINERPGDVRCLQTAVRVLSNLSNVHSRLSQFENAVEAGRRAVKYGEALVEASPRNRDSLRNLSSALTNLYTALKSWDQQNTATERLEIMRRTLDVRRLLADEFGDVVENKVRYLQTVIVFSQDFSGAEHASEVATAVDDAINRIGNWPVVDSAGMTDHFSGVLVSFATDVCALRACRFLGEGQYQQAATTLQMSWPVCFEFSSDFVATMVTTLSAGNPSTELLGAQQCKMSYIRLLRSMMEWEECASLAEEDYKLDATEKDQLVNLYRKQAQQLREESEKAYQSWRGHVDQFLNNQPDVGRRVFEFCKMYLVDELNDGSMFRTSHTEFDNRFYRFFPATMVKRFLEEQIQVRDGIRNLTSKNHWSRAYQLLGENYFRNGDWFEAVATLEQADQLADGKDFRHRLHLAVSHCHLGQMEQAKRRYVEAVAWLADNPNEKLASLRSEAERLLGLIEGPSEENSK